MTRDKSEILLTFRVDEQAVLTRGIRDVLAGLRLEDGGKVIVPIEFNGYGIANSAPCGTWQRVGSTPEGQTP